MFGSEEGELIFGITWQHVVRNVVISVTATWLALCVLRKYRKK
ncbi:MAG TPA: hypothetical protein VNK82_04870 [Terriglobales bacterium]|nr:hypothetical protein [Terriglobales bacterium]